jgi:hypothetical protein
VSPHLSRACSCQVGGGNVVNGRQGQCLGMAWEKGGSGARARGRVGALGEAEDGVMYPLTSAVPAAVRLAAAM